MSQKANRPVLTTPQRVCVLLCVLSSIMEWCGFCLLGRRYTVSIALPGSIIDNAQSTELKTYLAGQVNKGTHTSHVITYNMSLYRLLELLSYLMWMKSLSLMNQFKGKSCFHVMSSRISALTQQERLKQYSGL